MIEIKEGPELDRAVAEAIGDEPGLPFSLARADAGGEGFTYKMYSTDLNAALAAAEKVGLFEHYVLRQHPNGLWAMCDVRFDEEDPYYSNFTPNDYPTPALAICAGIRRLLELRKASR